MLETRESWVTTPPLLLVTTGSDDCPLPRPAAIGAELQHRQWVLHCQLRGRQAREQNGRGSSYSHWHRLTAAYTVLLPSPTAQATARR